MIQEKSRQIYEFLGEGYGFNGTEEDAINFLEERIKEVALYYADLAFVAGRSETTWEQFKKDEGLIE
jgi:hypothetical protein